jgi:hypothetical protein
MYVQADHEALIYRSEKMKKYSISSLAEENGEGPSRTSAMSVSDGGWLVGKCESASVMLTNDTSPYSQEQITARWGY